MWKLVLLLGESYLALGQAYKEDRQLHQALKIIELACPVYGSMPQKLEDSKFISSMIKFPSAQAKFNDRKENTKPLIDDFKDLNSSYRDNSLPLEQLSSTYFFWAKAWTLVEDIYVKFHIINGKNISKQAERKTSISELRISSRL